MTLRKIDLWAAGAWVLFIVLAAAEDLTNLREPWVTALAGLACTLTMVAYMSRRFEYLEAEAFDRGLRAGMQGLVDIREGQRQDY